MSFKTEEIHLGDSIYIVTEWSLEDRELFEELVSERGVSPRSAYMETCVGRVGEEGNYCQLTSSEIYELKAKHSYRELKPMLNACIRLNDVRGEQEELKKE